LLQLADRNTILAKGVSFHTHRYKLHGTPRLAWGFQMTKRRAFAARPRGG
jgi:hypothetical protein